MDLESDGNAALVTASSSGLGKASATALARQGVDVVSNGRDEERLAAAREEVAAEAEGRVVTQPGDSRVHGRRRGPGDAVGSPATAVSRTQAAAGREVSPHLTAPRPQAVGGSRDRNTATAI